jgi:nitronate monooxygenase
VLTTRFTKLVGCAVPIQQAGMGEAATPELAAAVSEAGGLGMLGTARTRADVNPTTFAALLEQTRELTNRPFGVNFIMRPELWRKPFEPIQFIEEASKTCRVVEFFYSEPDREYVQVVHNHGALAGWQVGSLEEAVKAAGVGCDFIVAQGVEAGGHIRGTIGTMDLLCEVLEAVPEIPVLAAGGVGTGRAMAAMLAAGADGVRVGTRFVASEEAGMHPVYTDALIAARAEDTVYTLAFHVGWPDAPHRVLKSSMAAAEDLDQEIVGKLIRIGGREHAVRRFSCAVPDLTATGRIGAMSLFAGQSVGGVKRVVPAREIIEELVTEAEDLLRRPH